ncbi:hypothetical protein NDU88_004536 [Pleurodeles waltl]|uniref:Secreted protein n=1 Tax=Pleurodeles waltl TaxID=8319 RepID=A0AAV7LII1_PLEWA|nr:hypothetical protein NDU88_004536 [Pleurodeles waltl]
MHRDLRLCLLCVLGSEGAHYTGDEGRITSEPMATPPAGRRRMPCTSGGMRKKKKITTRRRISRTAAVPYFITADFLVPGTPAHEGRVGPRKAHSAGTSLPSSRVGGVLCHGS